MWYICVYMCDTSLCQSRMLSQSLGSGNILVYVWPISLECLATSLISLLCPLFGPASLPEGVLLYCYTAPHNQVNKSCWCCWPREVNWHCFPGSSTFQNGASKSKQYSLLQNLCSIIWNVSLRDRSSDWQGRVNGIKPPFAKWVKMGRNKGSKSYSEDKNFHPAVQAIRS